MFGIARAVAQAATSVAKGVVEQGVKSVVKGVTKATVQTGVHAVKEALQTFASLARRAVGSGGALSPGRLMQHGRIGNPYLPPRSPEGGARPPGGSTGGEAILAEFLKLNLTDPNNNPETQAKLNALVGRLREMTADLAGGMVRRLRV